MQCMMSLSSRGSLVGPMALAAVILLVQFHCLFTSFYVCNYLNGEEKDDCFTLIVLLVSCYRFGAQCILLIA